MDPFNQPYSRLSLAAGLPPTPLSRYDLSLLEQSGLTGMGPLPSVSPAHTGLPSRAHTALPPITYTNSLYNPATQFIDTITPFQTSLASQASAYKPLTHDAVSRGGSIDPTYTLPNMYHSAGNPLSQNEAGMGGWGLPGFVPQQANPLGTFLGESGISFYESPSFAAVGSQMAKSPSLIARSQPQGKQRHSPEQRYISIPTSSPVSISPYGSHGQRSTPHQDANSNSPQNLSMGTLPLNLHQEKLPQSPVERSVIASTNQYYQQAHQSPQDLIEQQRSPQNLIPERTQMAVPAIYHAQQSSRVPDIQPQQQVTSLYANVERQVHEQHETLVERKRKSSTSIHSQHSIDSKSQRGPRFSDNHDLSPGAQQNNKKLFDNILTAAMMSAGLEPTIDQVDKNLQMRSPVEAVLYHSNANKQALSQPHQIHADSEQSDRRYTQQQDQLYSSAYRQDRVVSQMQIPQETIAQTKHNDRNRAIQPTFHLKNDDNRQQRAQQLRRQHQEEEHLRRQQEEQLQRQEQEELRRREQELLRRQEQEQRQREEQEQLRRQEQEHLRRQEQEHLRRQEQEQLRRQEQEQLRRQEQEQLRRQEQEQRRRQEEEQLRRQEQEQLRRQEQEQLRRQEEQELLQKQEERKLQKQKEKMMEQEIKKRQRLELEKLRLQKEIEMEKQERTKHDQAQRAKKTEKIEEQDKILQHHQQQLEMEKRRQLFKEEVELEKQLQQQQQQALKLEQQQRQQQSIKLEHPEQVPQLQPSRQDYHQQLQHIEHQKLQHQLSAEPRQTIVRDVGAQQNVYGAYERNPVQLKHQRSPVEMQYDAVSPVTPVSSDTFYHDNTLTSPVYTGVSTSLPVAVSLAEHQTDLTATEKLKGSQLMGYQNFVDNYQQSGSISNPLESEYQQQQLDLMSQQNTGMNVTQSNVPTYDNNPLMSQKLQHLPEQAVPDSTTKPKRGRGRKKKQQKNLEIEEMKPLENKAGIIVDGSGLGKSDMLLQALENQIRLEEQVINRADIKLESGIDLQKYPSEALVQNYAIKKEIPSTLLPNELHSGERMAPPFDIQPPALQPTATSLGNLNDVQIQQQNPQQQSLYSLPHTETPLQNLDMISPVHQLGMQSPEIISSGQGRYNPALSSPSVLHAATPTVTYGMSATPPVYHELQAGNPLNTAVFSSFNNPTHQSDIEKAYREQHNIRRSVDNISQPPMDDRFERFTPPEISPETTPHNDLSPLVSPVINEQQFNASFHSINNADLTMSNSHFTPSDNPASYSTISESVPSADLSTCAMEHYMPAHLPEQLPTFPPAKQNVFVDNTGYSIYPVLVPNAGQNRQIDDTVSQNNSSYQAVMPIRTKAQQKQLPPTVVSKPEWDDDLGHFSTTPEPVSNEKTNISPKPKLSNSKAGFQSSFLDFLSGKETEPLPSVATFKATNKRRRDILSDSTSSPQAVKSPAQSISSTSSPALTISSTNEAHIVCSGASSTHSTVSESSISNRINDDNKNSKMDTSDNNNSMSIQEMDFSDASAKSDDDVSEVSVSETVDKDAQSVSPPSYSSSNSVPLVRQSEAFNAETVRKAVAETSPLRLKIILPSDRRNIHHVKKEKSKSKKKRRSEKRSRRASKSQSVDEGDDAQQQDSSGDDESALPLCEEDNVPVSVLKLIEAEEDEDDEDDDDGEAVLPRRSSARKAKEKQAPDKKSTYDEDNDENNEDDDDDGSTYMPSDVEGEDGPVNYDSDSDPAWRPAIHGKKQPSYSTDKNNLKRSRNTPKTSKGSSNIKRSHHRKKPEVLPDKTSGITRKPTPHRRESEETYINPMSVNSSQIEEAGYRKGEFLLETKDLMNFDNYPIWKIVDGKMLQRYELFLDKGQVLHKATYTFSSWMTTMKNYFKPIRARNVRKDGAVQYVEVVDEDKPQPPSDGRLEQQYEDDPLVELFNVYMQMFISQALEPSFLDAIKEANDEFYLTPMEKVDALIEKKVKGIEEKANFEAKFKTAVRTRPNMRELSRPTTTVTCQVCVNSSQPAFKSLHLYGGVYDPFSLKESNAPDTPVSVEFLIGQTASQHLFIYHTLCHYKYNLYQRCLAKVKLIKESGPNKDGAAILDLCLQNRAWVLKLFEEFKELIEDDGKQKTTA